MTSDDPHLRDDDVVRTVGVGPWPGPPEQWPAGPQYDRELLAEGDRRNVADRYRYHTVEAIAADMTSRAHTLHLAVENAGRDLNMGSLVRTANAFNLASVQVIGRRRWNRRGAMVTDRYLRIEHRPTIEDFTDWASETGVTVIGIDNVPGSQPIEHRALPRDCVMVMGEEGAGISPEILAACDEVLAITQYGSTRSINVAAAGAIAMYSWILQHGHRPDDTGYGSGQTT